VDLDEFSLTMVKLQKKFIFDNEASEAEYERQKSTFIAANSKDEDNKFSEIFTITGYKDCMLCDEKWKTNITRSPVCLNILFFILFHSLCLGPCYRWWFNSLCGIRAVNIIKELSVDADESG